MFSDFLAPLDRSILEFKDSLPETSIGKNMICFKENCIDLSKIDIAIIGLNEYRGADDLKSNYLKTNSIRKEFYSLFFGDWNLNLIDLGDVVNGNKLSDTYFAVQKISQTLTENNVIAFFFGWNSRLDFPDL